MNNRAPLAIGHAELAHALVERLGHQGAMDLLHRLADGRSDAVDVRIIREKGGHVREVHVGQPPKVSSPVRGVVDRTPKPLTPVPNRA